jgi:hypothetical protein
MQILLQVKGVPVMARMWILLYGLIAGLAAIWPILMYLSGNIYGAGFWLLSAITIAAIGKIIHLKVSSSQPIMILQSGTDKEVMIGNEKGAQRITGKWNVHPTYFEETQKAGVRIKNITLIFYCNNTEVFQLRSELTSFQHIPSEFVKTVNYPPAASPVYYCRKCIEVYDCLR